MKRQANEHTKDTKETAMSVSFHSLINLSGFFCFEWQHDWNFLHVMKCDVEKVDLCDKLTYKKRHVCQQIGPKFGSFTVQYRFHGVLSQHMLIFSIVSLKEE